MLTSRRPSAARRHSLALLAASACGLLALAGAARAKPGPTTAETTKPARAAPPVTIERSRQVDFTSAINHRHYRLFEAVPYGPPPKGGYPVVYVLDGNYHFGTAEEFARQQAMFGVLKSAVVVGVGYADASPMQVLKLRNKDLTTPIAAAVLKTMPPEPGLDVPDTGGLDAFLKVIETEVKPRVAKSFRIDRSDQILFGHSLGGLAVVRAALTEPCAFRTFVAISPSLFWNNKAVPKDAEGFDRAVRSGRCAPRVYIGVGGLEQDPAAYRALTPLTPAQVTQIIDSTRMIDNARALVDQLRAVRGPGDHQTTLEVFPGESHLSEVPVAISHGLGFALKSDPTAR